MGGGMRAGARAGRFTGKMATSLRRVSATLALCAATSFCSSPNEDPTEPTAGRSSAGDEGSKPLSLPDPAIVPGTLAGYLPGRSEVTASGELTYSIPLDIPAGRAGMQPSLTLVY